MSINNISSNPSFCRNNFKNNINTVEENKYLSLFSLSGKELLSYIMEGNAVSFEYKGKNSVLMGLVIDNTFVGHDGYNYVQPKSVHYLESYGEITGWKDYSFSVFVDTDGKLSVYELYENSDGLLEYIGPFEVTRVQ